MEFLVELHTSLPPDWPDDRRAELLRREQERGVQLREQGTITAMWRIPGQLANVGVWCAPDATALHEALTSLPAWPWMSVTVTALAVHPLFAQQERTPAAAIVGSDGEPTGNRNRTDPL